MHNSIDISLSRFLMIASLVLLGILEYLWLHNEYQNKYRDMEDKINHVLFSNMRDVEDSLIFSSLANGPFQVNKDGEQITVNVLVGNGDSLRFDPKCFEEKAGEKGGMVKDMRIRAHHPVRGVLLQKLRGDSTGHDTGEASISTMVMHHIRMADSTGEYAGYDVISWQGNDTLLRGLVSRPQVDAMSGRQMALRHEDYKADIFHALLPHISFAVFLWMMVGAAFYYIWKNLRRQMQLNALRDEFVSNITHELKTPITTVGVALESLNLSDELRTSQSRRYLEICQGELKRLSYLVERILKNRTAQLDSEQLDIRQVLDDVMNNMKVQFDNKHAVVQVEQNGEAFIMHGDKSHMSSVLYNLLENALKYSSDHPAIVVKLSRDNGTIKLSVQDNGIGIASGYHEKIFEKLFRVPHQNRHDVKGHGLGLSYVADVVKKHHGSIDLVSEPGKGSIFSLTFPALHEN